MIIWGYPRPSALLRSGVGLSKAPLRCGAAHSSRWSLPSYPLATLKLRPPPPAPPVPGFSCAPAGARPRFRPPKPPLRPRPPFRFVATLLRRGSGWILPPEPLLRGVRSSAPHRPGPLPAALKHQLQQNQQAQPAAPQPRRAGPQKPHAARLLPLQQVQAAGQKRPAACVVKFAFRPRRHRSKARCAAYPLGRPPSPRDMLRFALHRLGFRR